MWQAATGSGAGGRYMLTGYTGPFLDGKGQNILNAVEHKVRKKTEILVCFYVNQPYLADD